MKKYRITSTHALVVGLLGLVPACGAEDPSGPSGTPGSSAESASTEQPELAFPGRTGELRTGKFETPTGVQELTYQLIDGEKVFQGDILLGEEITEDDPAYRSSGVTIRTSRWPNAVVNIENVGAYADSKVTAAVAHIERNTQVRFRYGVSSGNRLQFTNADASKCSSKLGMVGTDAQVVNIGGCTSNGNLIHELSHALGVFHEQMRTDRNSNVTHYPNCVLAGYADQFAIYGSEGMNIGPYDLSSIMHYGSTAFLDTAKVGCTATLTRPNGTTFNAQRTALTGTDIMGINAIYQAWTLRLPAVDWDGDGYDDISIWRPSNKSFFVRKRSNGATYPTKGAFGEETDVPVAMDYDADGKGDRAVFRPRTAQWFIEPTTSCVNGPFDPPNTPPSCSTNTIQWGIAGDVPTPGDFNGNGAAEPAVFRPNLGRWYFQVNGTSFDWGQAGDIPVQRDWDRDGYTDVAIWRPSSGDWWIHYSSTGGYDRIQWGVPGDIPVPGDYDGDGWMDLAVWRPSNGSWYIIRSSNWTSYVVQWGLYGDTPAPLDWNANGTTDLVVFRPTDGKWYINGVGTYQFGLLGDVPTP
jgi:hypothetical protein